ncbi:type II secretion system protein [uncultured Dubosiella sp.]|uniref:type II secretion system protein n=1 Tax=uncultured Dubosiella sp. TaxID=1937011 RepID=UPI0025B5E61C|nr:hypothetical protein [uncultured Dubosiella sp.]
MKRKRNPALIELMLVIVFFSLASLILLQMFAKAFTLSKQNIALANGQILLEDLMNQWMADPATPVAQDGVYRFNEEMNLDPDGRYLLCVERSETETLASITLTLQEQETTLIDFHTTIGKEESK